MSVLASNYNKVSIVYSLEVTVNGIWIQSNSLIKGLYEKRWAEVQEVMKKLLTVRQGYTSSLLMLFTASSIS